MSNPEPPPYPSGDNSDLPSYGSVPPPPGSGGTPPPPPPPPPGGGVPGWQPPGPTGPAQNQKALIALILGIISVPFMFCCGCIGIGTGAGALACGILGRKEIQASGGAQAGDGMALAGIILGVLGIVVSAVLMLLGVAANFGSFNPNSFTP